jgi:hypothetical protein
MNARGVILCLHIGVRRVLRAEFIDEVFGRMHDTETNLLRAFKGWADCVDMRVKGFGTLMSALPS